MFTAGGPVFYFQTLTSLSVWLRTEDCAHHSQDAFTHWEVCNQDSRQWILTQNGGIFLFTEMFQCSRLFGYHVASELSGQWYTNAAGIKAFIACAALQIEHRPDAAKVGFGSCLLSCSSTWILLDYSLINQLTSVYMSAPLFLH